ncbi:FUSC family protein [Oerskovia paurometabola]|uniref:FUSC family protein n=1 Tax=Oerskovia paurometabola TaxID=162170 RepID=A0ABW1XGP8_9CELL|nr:FUSC family protein [Oerskovia paurometabola]MBM7496720.1 putative membrane protein YccC [Oerskovia paurometabola]
METVWLVLGIVILALTLLDVFLTALNYDESGFIAGPLAAGQWRLLRRVTRRMSRRWRPLALRQVTGLQIMVTVVAWLFGVILGFGLIYYGQMTKTAFSVSGTGASLDFFNAMYFSAAQLSTVGGSSLTAETDVLRFLSIAETLTGVVLVSLILTFLLGVYDVIRDLRALSAQFFSAERGAGSPVASLAPFFQQGEPSGLDGHVDGIADSFSSYTDGLRLHHAAYYFQSGRDQFALPYAIRMLGGTLGALRWGLPAGHPATATPGLVPLTFQFLEFGEYLQKRLRWTSHAVPEVVSSDEFAGLARSGHHRGRQDEWVARFVELDRDMADLAGIEPLTDLDDAYRRYTQWLPFAYRAQQITFAVSRDLDYQPIIVTDKPVSILHTDDALVLRFLEEDVPGPVVGPGAGPVADPSEPAERSARSRISRWETFVDQHVSLVDPGYARLRGAGRAVLAASAAVVSLYVLFEATGRDGLQPAMFGGFVAMLSTGISVDKTQRGRKVTSILLIAPVSLVVVLGALVSRSPVWTAVLVVAVAGLGVWVGRFGPRWAALGQVTFVAYYFALILRLHLTEVLLYITAAALGVVWAWVLNYVILPERPLKVLRGGIDGFGRRLVTSMDALVDAVSWARWDPDIVKRVRLDMRELHRGAAFLAGQLTGGENATGIEPARSAEVRLHLFDTELAAVNLMTAARNVTGTAIPLELRGRLAGRIELLQAHLAEIAARPVDGSPPAAPATQLAPWQGDRPPAEWPQAARLLYQACTELYRAADVLRTAEVSSLDPDAPPLATVDPDGTQDDEAALDELVAPSAPPQDGKVPMSPVTKRAVQAAVATGAALGIGEAVSTTHQYWATISAYQVLGGTDGETFVKGAQRIAGTVLGAAVGFGVAIWTGADPAIVLPLIAVAIFASRYYQQVSPAVSSFWMTMFFALLYEFLGRLTTLAVEVRILETLFGAAVALAVAWFVFPTRTRTKLNKDVATLLRDVEIVITAGLERLAGGTKISRKAIEKHLLVITQDVRRVNATAAPLRRAAGALEVGGIEGRLTAVWSLTYYTRHLARAVERMIEAGADVSSEDWDRLRRTTSANISALRAVLADRLPGTVEENLDFGSEYDPTGPPTRPQDVVLRQVERINQTLVVLIESIAPGATGKGEEAASAPL